MPKRLVYLILISSIIRIFLASVLELSNDEVYYYLYALDLQPNYFDHPPGVGVLIRIFTFNLNLHHELFVRLGAIVCAALGTGLSYRLGTLLKNERTGWFAAVLYTTGIYTSIIAGTFIIPDSPQLVFWLAALVVMYEIILKADKQEKIPLGHWIVFGVCVGLCILCKVHGIFLWFGFGMYILAYQRRLLSHFGLYLAVLVTLTCISPILWWNFQNDFITYRFHSERVAVRETLFHFDYFIQTIGGQLLYNNPVNAVLILISLWKIRSGNYLSRGAIRFVVWNGLPIILVVTGMSLFNSMLPHWSGPGFLVLAFLAAACLDEKAEGVSFALPAVVKAGGVLVFSAAIAAAALINLYPGTLGSREPSKYGDGDFTLDMYGWRKFSEEFSPWFIEQKRAGQIPADIKIVSDQWFPAAHLDFYVAAPLNMNVIGVGQVTDLHQYYWLNKSRSNPWKGESAICIVPTNNPRNLETSFLKYFSSATLLKTFESKRSGKLVRYFEVYQLHDYLMNDEMHKSADVQDDKAEIQKLMQQVLTWSESKASIDLEPVLVKEGVYVFDRDKLKENLNKLRETGFFSTEFIENYNKIILALDGKFRKKEFIDWLEGDLPPFKFSNDIDPWCMCQGFSVDQFDEIRIVKIDDKSGEMVWIWKKGSDWIDFNFRVVKESGQWKISYLQGFDYTESITGNGE